MKDNSHVTAEVMLDYTIFMIKVKLLNMQDKKIQLQLSFIFIPKLQKLNCLTQQAQRKSESETTYEF